MKETLDSVVRDIKKAAKDLDKYGFVLDDSGNAMSKDQFLAKFFPVGLTWGTNREVVVSELANTGRIKWYFFYQFFDDSAGVVGVDLATGREVRNTSKEVVEAIGTFLVHLRIYSPGRRG